MEEGWLSCGAACDEGIASQFSPGWAGMPEDVVSIVEGLKQMCLPVIARKDFGP